MSEAYPFMRSFPLFEHMSREHGLTLMESELDEIERIVVKMLEMDVRLRTVDDASDGARIAAPVYEAEPSKFEDTPLLAAKRCAFDSPTHANLDALIQAAQITTGTQSEATYGGGIQVKDMDAHDIADAILRARPKPFMPATRLCTACDTALPDSLPPTIHKCSRCRNEL